MQKKLLTSYKGSDILITELADTQGKGGRRKVINARELKAEIRRNGTTQEKLARKIGMDPSTLNRKINNKQGVLTVDEAQKIADELKIPSVKLLSIFFARELADTQV